MPRPKTNVLTLKFVLIFAAVFTAVFMSSADPAPAVPYADPVAGFDNRMDSSGFGGEHLGVDIPAEIGSEVFAVMDGTVAASDTEAGFIILKHTNNYGGTFFSLYGNVKGQAVLGSAVTRGSVIGIAAVYPEGPEGQNQIHFAINTLRESSAFTAGDIPEDTDGFTDPDEYLDAYCVDTAQTLEGIGLLDRGNAPGQRGNYPAGSYADMTDKDGRRFDNMAGYIIVPKGLGVIAFREPDFQGDYIKIVSTVDLEESYNSGWNDDISSMIVMERNEALDWAPSETQSPEGLNSDTREAVPESISIESISILNYPSKMFYTAGEYLDNSGLIVEALYSDGTTEQIYQGLVCTPAIIVGDGVNVSGTQDITVTYQDKTTVFTVNWAVSGQPVSQAENVFPAPKPLYTSAFNGNTYTVFDVSADWQTAKYICEQMGGHLVTIGSLEEEIFAEALADGGGMEWYWLGASGEYGSWQWVTGEHWDYENWGDGQPGGSADASGNIENYLSLRRDANTWDNLFSYGMAYGSPYERRGGYICEWETAQAPVPEPVQETPVEIPTVEIPAVEIPAVEIPIEAPVEMPIETPTEIPAETPVETPAETPIETPVEIPVETSAPDPSANPWNASGNLLYSGVRAYIDNYAVPVSEAEGRTVVSAEDLRNYGFDVVWDETARALNVNPGGAGITPLYAETDAAFIGTLKGRYAQTDIKVYLSGEEAQGIAAGGAVLIDFGSLAKYGDLVWDEAARELRLGMAGEAIAPPVESLPQDGGTGQETPGDSNIEEQTFPVYELGTVVNLSGEDSVYKYAGWSGPEEWGTWTDGEETVLAMSVGSYEDLLLHADVQTIRNPNPVDIYVNDVIIASSQFAAGDNVIEIPKELYSGDGNLLISFMFRDVTSPLEEGKSSDPRKLSIGVSSFYLEPVSQ